MFIVKGADFVSYVLNCTCLRFLKEMKKNPTNKEYDSKILQSCSVLTWSKIVLH